MRFGVWKRLAPKNWCFWTVVLEKTLENPLDCKEIQPVHSKRDQPWDFFGRNDAKAETPVLWPSHVKSWLIGKDPDAGRDWGQEEKGTTEDWILRDGTCLFWLSPRWVHLGLKQHHGESPSLAPSPAPSASRPSLFPYSFPFMLLCLVCWVLLSTHLLG